MSSPTVSTQLQRIAAQAVQEPERIFTNLAHLIDVNFLREAHRRTRKDKAAGVDKVTAKDYAVDLEENLHDLHERLRNGSYEAPPVRRTWLEKEDGKKRPIGIPAFEDKIVQRAVVMLMGAIYERIFYRFSHGFRPSHSQHQALKELRAQCLALKIRWILDVDVSGFFDNLDHCWLRKMIQHRVNDGSLLRLIGKWLNAGVLEDESLTYPEKGTPQGGVISPLLSNIFLHYVLDDWFVKVVQPQVQGRVFLLRFADDFIIGCEREEDAQRIMAALPDRFGRFGLSIHPTKTAVVAFGKPGLPMRSGTGNGTFDFLGFTHYWARSRRGYWVIKRRTIGKRVRRARKAIWQWCRWNRHEPLVEQYHTLCQKLRGHYQYYGVRSNYRSLEKVYEYAQKAWRYWLHRRSREKAMPWDRFERLMERFPLPKPRIIHSI